MNPGGSLEQALLQTVAYGDVFQFPLTRPEIHRYLIGLKASPEEIDPVLRAHPGLAQCGPFFMLPGREGLFETRLRREKEAARLWPTAIRYGRMLAGLPYVRMVALTGSLAMHNVEPGADLDYLVVTQAGRLWLARGLVILLVRLAARRGDRVCPNYFLTETALALPDQNIFSAHELVQMAPISGNRVYAAMRQANSWTEAYLPNASGAPALNVPAPGRAALNLPVLHLQAVESSQPFIQALGERCLENPLGDLVEGWEMRRKLDKFGALQREHREACFGPDCCKGHVGDHGERVLSQYTQRMRGLDLPVLDLPEVERIAG